MKMRRGYHIFIYFIIPLITAIVTLITYYIAKPTQVNTSTGNSVNKATDNSIVNSINNPQNNVINIYNSPKNENSEKKETKIPVVNENKKKVEKERSIENNKETNISKKVNSSTNISKDKSLVNSYINHKTFLNSKNIDDFIVCFVSSDKYDSTLSSKVSESLKQSKANVSFSFFKEIFIKDGLFNKIFNGDSEIADKLKLTEHCDLLFLGKKHVNYSGNPDLDNDLITAKVSWDVRVITNEGIISQSFILNESGIGFNQHDAENKADDRIIKLFKEKIRLGG